MTAFNHGEWLLRVFGSEDAYRRSLPNRYWHQTAAGAWFSSERGLAADLAAERLCARESAE